MRGALLVLGMALLVLGGQGAVRLLADHDNAGLFGWVPGGFIGQLAAYAVVVAAGVALTVRASRSAATRR